MLNEAIQQNQELIDMHSFKARVSDILPDGSILRSVLIREPDTLSKSDLVAKLGTWLEILDEEEF